MLGGGPAGCAAATLLARRSHEVALVRPAATAAGALAESIPPSANKLLAELGVLEAVERAGFHANLGNTVWWAGAPARSEPFADGGRGYHVDRRGLEDVLVRAADTMGVRTYDGFAARSAEESAAGWSVSCESADGSRLRLSAPWLVDATGRRGVVARREGREPDPRTTTLALLGRWRTRHGWARELQHHTLIESYRDGWAWSVPLGREERCFSAVIDQRYGDLEGLGSGAILHSEMAKTEHIGPLLAGAEPVGEAWGCPASLYTSRRFGRPGLLLVGDAGSFIDPLSSFGVKKALSSGWLGGVVAHTGLVDPPMTDTAVNFFDARERAVYRTYRRLSAAFFEDASEAYGHAYWRARAEAARAAGGWADAATTDPDRLGPPSVPESAVREAFEVIRGRELLGAAPAPSLRTFEAPAIDGHRIVLKDHLASDTCPEGLRFVLGVDLRRLVEEAPKHREVPDVWAAYNGVAAPVTLPDFLTALATAFAAGLLVHRSE